MIQVCPGGKKPDAICKKPGRRFVFQPDNEPKNKATARQWQQCQCPGVSESESRSQSYQDFVA